MNAVSDIVVATSIPPKIIRYDNGREVGHEYQKQCIASWLDAGFRVLSLNSFDEIGELAACYPGVQFIAMERDAREISGRKTPFIVDMLSVLARQPEPVVGIANADICFESGRNWREAIASSVDDAIMVVRRVEIGSLSAAASEVEKPEVYRHGFDLFFFENTRAFESVDCSFAMGLPWWDYWLPIAFRLQGRKVRLLTEPTAFHFRHPANYDDDLWQHMAREFAEFVTVAVDSSSAGVARDLLPVVKACRKLAALPRNAPLRPSLVDAAWDRLVGTTRDLPVLWRLAGKARGPNAALHRLSETCSSMISQTAVAKPSSPAIAK
jgi:hypothetical protein